ncbi:MAG TPA: OB-fold domain-containing protein, partial [Streptosporangiaceae bacterium]|nr:OB-fold domain-containing protein [Streptosporangiaceae bacterium]
PARDEARPPRPAAPDLGQPMRPVISPDTAFFWAGTAVGELRVQSCGDCGTLRHPPGPLCMACGSPNPKYIVAAGTGEVFSYVVHHHPPVPGKKLPLVIALVELTEGVRVLAELTGVDPDKVEVGMPVEVTFLKVDEELVLPAWRPAAPVSTRPVELPGLVVDVSTTFVVASALATRDFTKVHHDRDFAVASGSKDIFVNILSTTGLVQRFVSAWAGHQAIFRSIKIRLGAPCYAGDTLAFTGQVTEHSADTVADRYEIAVVGKNSLGNHVTSTVCVDIPCQPGGTTPQNPPGSQS